MRFKLLLLLLCAIQIVAQDWYQMMISENPNYYEVVKAYESYYETNDFVKNGQTQQYKQWCNKMLQFKDANGFYQAPDWNLNNDAGFTQMKSSYSRDESWYEIGPWGWHKEAEGQGHAPGITRMNTVEQDPNDSNVVYVGTAQAGIWKSSDNGDHWSCLSNDLMVKAVGAIEINRNNSNEVLFGAAKGIYRSTDSGLTFSITNLEYDFYANFHCWEIKQIPTFNPYYLAATTTGLYKSIDGLDWELIESGTFYEIEHHPTNYTIIYTIKRNGSTCDFKKSIDGGDTFNTIADGVPEPGSGQNTQRHEIAVTISAPNRVFMLAPGNANGNDSGLYGFYLSDDAGESFTFQCCGEGPGGVPAEENPNIMTWNANGVGTSGQIWYDVALAASPSDVNTVFTGGVNTWRSHDAGQSFTCNAHWSIWSDYPNTKERYNHADVHDIKYYINDKIWIVSDGGVFLSEDGGDNFTDKTNGIQGTEFWGVHSAFRDGDVITGGTVHNGTLVKQGDVYDGWHHLYGGDCWNGYVNYGAPEYIYVDNAGGDYKKVKLSGDPLVSPNKGPNLHGFDYGECSNLEFHPNCFNHLYQFVQDKLYVSPDNGTTWEIRSEVQGINGLSTLKISWSNPKVMYVANDSSNNAVFKSIDGGFTWTDIKPPVELYDGHDFPRLTALDVDGLDENVLWIVIGGQHEGFKVLKSENGGASWIDYSGSLPSEAMYSIVHQKGTNGGVYVGSDLGVYYRSNDLEDWVPYMSDLPPMRSIGLQPFYGQSKIRNYTRGRGVWESDSYETSNPIAVPSANLLSLTCLQPTVHFFDHSILASENASWSWSFEGGFPATSTAQDPQVEFIDAGFYDVTLTVTDDYGSHTITVEDMIEVKDISHEIPDVQSFEFGTVLQQDWQIENPDEDQTWQFFDANEGPNCASTTCFYIDHHSYNNPGTEDYLISPIMQLMDVVNPLLSFNYAYARWGGANQEGLRIHISTDCGVVWEEIFFAEGADLSTVDDQQDWWQPQSCNDWANVSIDLLAYENEEVIIRFESINGWGNNFFLDEIQVTGDIPSIIVEPFAPIDFGPQIIGGDTQVVQYVVSGHHLTEDIIIESTNSQYLISLDNANFGNQVVLDNENGLVNDAFVFVQFLPTMSGNFNEIIAHNSGTAKVIEIPVSGIGQEETDGFPGRCVYLDGVNDFVSIPPLYLNTNAMTITAWVRPDGSTQNDWAGLVFTRGNGTTSGISVKSDLELRYHWDGQGDWGFSSGLYLESGVWNHVAMVIEPNAAHLYVNGVQATNERELPVKEWGAEVRIGNDNNNSSRYFKGRIDEVAIYNQSLTIDEIRTNRHLTKQINDEGLSHYYQLNNSGSNVQDKISAYNGSLQEGAQKVTASEPAGFGVAELDELNGTIEFSEVGMSLIASLDSDTDFVVTKLYGKPNATSGINNEEWIIDGSYYVLNEYANDELEGLVTMQFEEDWANWNSIATEKIKIYKRNENDHGAWSFVGHPNLVDGSGEIHFNIESGGQYIFTITDGLLFNANVTLEGYYDPLDGDMNVSNIEKDVIPFMQPFSASFGYNGTETLTNWPFFGVDWILVQARNAVAPYEVLESRAGLLYEDGRIHEVNGDEGIRFYKMDETESYRFSVKQKAHLGVLSSNDYQLPLASSLDFGEVDNAEGIEQLKELSDGSYALYAGDYDGNSVINSLDFNVWRTNSAAVNQYLFHDSNGNGVINVSDYNLWYGNRSKVGVLTE